jgi:hypothetical protein
MGRRDARGAGPKADTGDLVLTTRVPGGTLVAAIDSARHGFDSARRHV